MTRLYYDPRRRDPIQNERCRARDAVKYALQTGRIHRGPCARVDATCKGRIEAHHDSYEPARWLDVTWICASHHRREHPHGTAKKAIKKLELGTARLRIECSTTELSRRDMATERRHVLPTTKRPKVNLVQHNDI